MIITVSGARGIVGKDLTVSVASQLAATFVGRPRRGGRYLLARDTRPSGRALSLAAAAGILASGAEATDLGVVTTPGACLMVRQLSADGAIVITASHNPIQWNGMKFIGPDGKGISAQHAAGLKEAFEAGDWPSFDDPTQIGRIDEDSSTHTRHIKAVLDVCREDLLEKLQARKLKVVLDSVNGAGCMATPQLLQKLSCEVIHINGQPTGIFAHTPEPTAENLTGLCEAVKEHKADVGFAQDPDADRLAIVDENGTYIGEEYTLALAVMFVLSQTPGPVAANLSTSRMIDDVAAMFGQRVIRTPVGEANVAAAIVDNRCPVGGEGNGGVIFPQVVPIRDSFTGIALILQLIADTSLAVSELVERVPRYAMIKTKVPIGQADVGRILERIAAELDPAEQNTADGLRLDWPQKGCWLHVRPSNTEPIIRIIAEARQRSQAEELIERTKQIMKNEKC